MSARRSASGFTTGPESYADDGNIDRDCWVKFIEHRVGDKRIVRLIQKWLNAGIIEGTDWSDNGKGTPPNPRSVCARR
ncbi:MAG: hypothetical protein O3C40_20820 [Planctomycetota bacterium]|nr:hypothetical protein [Planctomycetota bacterium]